MNIVKFLWMRAQLVCFIRGLSDAGYQKRNWSVYRPDQEQYDELDYTVHFFYDDTSLASDTSSFIGVILCNEEEVPKVCSIISALDIVFEKYGLRLKDAEYLEKPEWTRVVEAASDAFPIFEANGVGSLG